MKNRDESWQVWFWDLKFQNLYFKITIKVAIYLEKFNHVILFWQYLSSPVDRVNSKSESPSLSQVAELLVSGLFITKISHIKYAIYKHICA